MKWDWDVFYPELDYGYFFGTFIDTDDKGMLAYWDQKWGVDGTIAWVP